LVFARLADIIVRRHKAIIVLWVVLLAAALPFAPMVQEVLVYEETSMAPEYLESERAMSFIEGEFSGVTGGGSTIIVLTSDDVMDNGTKGAIYRMDKELFNASHDGRIDGDVRVASVYSILTDYSAGVMFTISDGLSEGKEIVNLTSQLIFGVPIGFRQLYSQTNLTSFAVYGIPDLHVGMWQSVRMAHPNWTTEMVDQEAYLMSAVALATHPIIQGMNETMRSMAWGWFSSYTSAWNLTMGNITLEMDPLLRAGVSIDLAFPSFLTAVPSEYREFLSMVKEGLHLGTWDDHHLLNSLCESVFERSLDTHAKDYFELFYSRWNATDSEPDDSGFEQMVSSAVTEYAHHEGEEGEMVMMVFEVLGFGH
jgi:hypothetical protein